MNCYNCQKELGLETTETIFRSAECPHCYSSIRCCKMCKFYDKNSYNECKEPSADRILEKEKSNFCDFYKIGTKQSPESNASNLLDQANSLFKD